jgi:uncharacterized surface protein with fasciclin (FAS1) repeats
MRSNEYDKLRRQNVRWEENTEKRRYSLDIFFAEDKIWEANKEKYINWNTFQNALEKIKSNENSVYIGGLFDQVFIKKENLHKPIEDWD